jgi:hypothetical protein
VSSQRYALAGLSLWEEPRYQWVRSFDDSIAYLDTVEENRYIALGFLTPLLDTGEWPARRVGRFIPLGTLAVTI